MLNVEQLINGYSKSARSLGELLPWTCLYDEGTTLTLDQGLLACFKYQGIDAEGRTETEIDAAVSTFERAFSSFGSGTAIWSMVNRRKSQEYPYGRFANPIAAHLESVWAQSILPGNYANTYSMAVYQRSNDGAMALFDAMDRIVKEQDIGLGKAFLMAIKSRMSTKAKITYDRRAVESAKVALEARVADLMSNLGSLGLQRLQGEELLGFLHGCANPVSGVRHRFPQSPIPAFLNHLLANDQLDRRPRWLEFTDGVHRKFVGVVSLKGWPLAPTVPGMLDHLTSIEGEITIAHCFRPLDRQIALKAIDSLSKYHMTASVPVLQRLIAGLRGGDSPMKQDEGRLFLAQDAKDAAAEAVAFNRAFGYHNLTVLVYADSQQELDSLQSQVMRRLSLTEFTGFGEGMHALAAWSQTIPGNWQSGVRWTNVSFGNQADIAPIRTLWTGPSECKYLTGEMGTSVPVLVSLPTDAGVSFNWDIFESGAGHTAFIGPTRAGKSVFVNFCLSQFRKIPGARVIQFDKDYSGYIPTLLMDGDHVDLTNDRAAKGQRLAPIGLVGDLRHHPFVINWVRKLIEHQTQRILDSGEIETIAVAVAGLKKLPEARRTLGQLATEMGRTLGAPLQEWIGDGPRAGWFDNEPQNITIGDAITFEMKELFKDRAVARFAMEYLFYIVELALQDRRPTVINVEETWFFYEDPEFQSQIDNFLRTAGKLRAAVWVTTQSAYEMTNTDKLKAMLEQFKNLVFLPNAAILQNQSGYNLMGVTQEQLVRIAQATPKRDYYIKTPTMSRMCVVELPAEIIHCVTAGARAIETFKKHYANRDESGAWKAAYHEEMMR